MQVVELSQRLVVWTSIVTVHVEMEGRQTAPKH